MITIDRCPSLLIEGHTTYSKNALRDLFDGKNVSHVLGFSSPESGNSTAYNSVRNAGRLSLSGAQSKFGLILDAENNLQYSPNNVQSTYILKPRPVGYHLINHDYCAANENLTMQMASQIYGIETAHNALCFYNDGQPAYITRRFDVHADGKYAQEDFASLMGFSRDNGGSDFKYSKGSYEECAEVIRGYVKAASIDILNLFRLVLYNFITLNDDAHLKNFSLIKRNGEYRLSPAYDLINTALQVYEPRLFALEKGLFKEGMYLSDTRYISHKDFAEFGRRIGLPEKLYTHEIVRFATPNEEADRLIRRSFLSVDLQESYIRSMHYRQTLLRPH